MLKKIMEKYNTAFRDVTALIQRQAIRLEDVPRERMFDEYGRMGAGRSGNSVHYADNGDLRLIMRQCSDVIDGLWFEMELGRIHENGLNVSEHFVRVLCCAPDPLLDEYCDEIRWDLAVSNSPEAAAFLSELHPYLGEIRVQRNESNECLPKMLSRSSENNELFLTLINCMLVRFLKAAPAPETAGT